MDTLPFELLMHVLSYLPPSTFPPLRLTCHRFNAALAKLSFPTLATFTDPQAAKSTLESIAADLSRRPRAIWSPACSVPEGLPIPGSFLSAMSAALTGRSCPLSLVRAGAGAGWNDDGESSDSGISMTMEEDAEVNVVVTAGNFGKWLGREEITEKILQQALFRYALYLSYIYRGKGEAPQLWVMSRKLWKEQI